MCVCEAKGWEQNGFFTRVICVGWEGLSCLCVCRDWDQNCGKIPHWDWLQRMGLNTNTSPSIYPTLFPLPLHISGCKLLPIWMLLLYWLRSDQILEPCGRILCLGLSTWSWRWQSCFFSAGLAMILENLGGSSLCAAFQGHGSPDESVEVYPP